MADSLFFFFSLFLFFFRRGINHQYEFLPNHDELKLHYSYT